MRVRVVCLRKCGTEKSLNQVEVGPQTIGSELLSSDLHSIPALSRRRSSNLSAAMAEAAAVPPPPANKVAATTQVEGPVQIITVTPDGARFQLDERRLRFVLGNVRTSPCVRRAMVRSNGSLDSLVMRPTHLVRTT